MSSNRNREDLAPAIRVSGLGKLYELYKKPQDRIKQLFALGGKKYYREHWALKDVAFDVKPGEAFGIIGRNGAGKSTLLQLLAGVLEPTEGEIIIPKKVTALLELGSGFKPEFTGRQNVFVNAAVLGIPRRIVKERMDDIIAFADIGQYIDQPVKTYSSGMFLRLAFAVTTSLEPEVLIIDEALAVGDVFFRQKCYDRLEGLMDKGVIVVLVSHALNDVAQFCHRALFLSGGKVEFLGDASEAVKLFMLKAQTGGKKEPAITTSHAAMSANLAADLPAEEESQGFWPEQDAFLDLSGLTPATNGWTSCTHVALCDAEGRPCRGFEQGETAYVHCRYEILEDMEIPVTGIELINDKRTIVFGKNTLQFDCPVPETTPAGSVLRISYAIKLDLAPGEYTFNLGFTTISRKDFAHRAEFSHPELDARTTVVSTLSNVGGFMVTFRMLDTRPVQLTHHGVANLPGQAGMELLARRGEGG